MIRLMETITHTGVCLNAGPRSVNGYYCLPVPATNYRAKPLNPPRFHIVVTLLSLNRQGRLHVPDKSMLDVEPSVELQMQTNLGGLDAVVAQMVLNIRDGSFHKTDF